MPIRFQVDPDFYDHPKTIGMSDAATALWVRAGSYCAAKLTDGFLADATLALLSQTWEEAARELMRRGLWKRVRGGYRFHQWGERNLSRARVESDRSNDRQRKRRERETARQNGKPQVEGTLVPPDVQPDSGGNPNGIHPVSVSVSVSESVSGSGRGSPSVPGAVGEPPRQCRDHRDDPDPPPCGKCADARRAHGRWEAAQSERINNAPKCRAHRGQLAHNCAICRSEELSPP